MPYMAKEVGLPSLFLIKVNYFLGNPSAPRPEQTSFGSCCPRLGQKKEVLVRPVALVGSLNEF